MTLQYTNKKLIRCSRCHQPLAEVEGHEIYLLKYHHGEPVRIKIAVKHDFGGRFDISCECGFAFSTVLKSLSMTYVVARPQESHNEDESS